MTAFLSTEPNWGLPLAIAANLHVPYRIEIGFENIDKANIEDKRGKGKFSLLFNLNVPSDLPLDSYAIIKV